MQEWKLLHFKDPNTFSTLGNSYWRTDCLGTGISATDRFAHMLGTGWTQALGNLCAAGGMMPLQAGAPYTATTGPSRQVMGRR